MPENMTTSVLVLENGVAGTDVADEFEVGKSVSDHGVQVGGFVGFFAGRAVR